MAIHVLPIQNWSDLKTAGADIWEWGVGPGPPTPAPSPSVFPICTTVSETSLQGSVAPADATVRDLVPRYQVSGNDHLVPKYWSHRQFNDCLDKPYTVYIGMFAGILFHEIVAP